MFSFPTLAEVKAKHAEAIEAEREAQRKAEEARTPEGMAARQAAYAEMKAAYASNLAKAILDYTQYLRELTKEAIIAHASKAWHTEVERPHQKLTINLQEYGAEFEEGCWGEAELGEGRMYKWVSENDYDIDARHLLNHENGPIPLETLKRELESAGYTIDCTKHYCNWTIVITVPLA